MRLFWETGLWFTRRDQTVAAHRPFPAGAWQLMHAGTSTPILRLLLQFPSGKGMKSCCPTCSSIDYRVMVVCRRSIIHQTYRKSI